MMQTIEKEREVVFNAQENETEVLWTYRVLKKSKKLTVFKNLVNA